MLRARPTPPAFANALSVPGRARPCRASPRFTACAPANPHPDLSPAAVALFRRQAATPIFAPSLVQSVPLADRIAALQAQSPPAFATSADLSADAGGPATAARLAAADHIAERAPQLVAAARRDVLRAFPGIDAPGGALYPAFRADACWRDLMAFLRVAGYMLVSGADTYSDDGLSVLRAVYTELAVPTDAVAEALHALGRAAAPGLDAASHEAVLAALEPLADAVRRM